MEVFEIQRHSQSHDYSEKKAEANEEVTIF
jgi:hypothetical protein